jgi:hypothetical protein
MPYPRRLTLYKTATLVQDATVQLFSESPQPSNGIGVVRSCALGTNGQGVCVEQIWAEGNSTYTTTYTGSIVPYYTLTAGGRSSGGVATQQYSRFIFVVSSIVVVLSIMYF